MAAPKSVSKREGPAKTATNPVSQPMESPEVAAAPSSVAKSQSDVDDLNSENAAPPAPPRDSSPTSTKKDLAEAVSEAPDCNSSENEIPNAFPSVEAIASQYTQGNGMPPSDASNSATGAVRDRPQSPKKRPHPDELADNGEPSNKKSKEFPTTPTKASTPISPRFPSPPEERASPKDKERWQGWCEIESDPAYISAMMRLMGVQGVSVRQVFAVDELKMLVQPIYGLILLYRYRESDGIGKQEQRSQDNIWFANQLPAQNSCATLAMFNILMNSDDVKLGENLEEFKKFTATFTPSLRGEAFASFQFVKRIHNSFAKKMDMLEDDAHLSNKVQKSKMAGRRKGSNASNESIEDNGHHFIAFVPIDGHVWKLDGLNYQPTDVGPYDPADPDAWLEPASTRIMDLMAAAGDQDYSLLSVIQSPVVGLRNELCKSYATIRYIETRLDNMQEDWRSFLIGESTSHAAAPGTPSLLSALGVTQEQLASVELQEDFKQSIESADLETLLARRSALIADQQRIESEIFTEMDTEALEDAKAKERQWDYGPIIQKWLEMLARNGYLEANINKHKAK